MNPPGTTTGNTLFIFRRDLRLDDNTGLITALENTSTSSRFVLPGFIFDDRLLNTKNRNYHTRQFMLESLRDLDRQLRERDGKLFLFYGKPEEVITQLITQVDTNITSVYVNRDYTPYSRIRDKRIEEQCIENDIEFHQYSDLMLNEPGTVLKKDKTPYTVFTPFFKKANQRPIPKPKKNQFTNYCTTSLEIEAENKLIQNVLPEENPNLAIHGGRTNALKILNDLDRFSNYSSDRDFPSKPSTTKLSAHLKFGTVSIREVYYAIKNQFDVDHPLIRQLYWRDFYTQIGYHFPRVFKRSFRSKYDKLDWNYDEKAFHKWCEGKTGFPIVDAGMRELNRTGYMHNRVRMIVASFLTKDLQIDWRWGERFFAKKLVDYDPAVNNGNWQWAASTGCDPVPYFRIFNPWLQQRKYDPECEYIKEHIPELRSFPPSIIHNFEKTHPNDIKNYPPPMVDHKKVKELTKAMFKSVN